MSIVMLGYDYSVGTRLGRLTSRCVGFPLDDINVTYVAGQHQCTRPGPGSIWFCCILIQMVHY